MNNKIINNIIQIKDNVQLLLELLVVDMFDAVFLFHCSKFKSKKMASKSNKSASSASPQLRQQMDERIHNQHRIEELAEEIIVDQQQQIDLNIKRNTNRECLAALRDLKKNSNNDSNNNSKTWMCCGPFFVRLPTETLENLVKKDQATLDDEINKTHEELKQKVYQLSKLDPNGQYHDAKYFAGLKPMNK